MEDEPKGNELNSGFPLNASISFPIAEHTVQSLKNLICMIHSRGPLLSKATGGTFSANIALADEISRHDFRSIDELIAFLREWNETSKRPCVRAPKLNRLRRREKLMQFPNEKQLQSLRERYPAGTRIRLNHMNDPYAPVQPGTIGEVTADEIPLDRYEGYPHLYRRETVQVELNGKTVDAMVYIMNSNGVRPPDHFYYGIIRQGYEMNGLDISFLEQARQESLTGR